MIDNEKGRVFARLFYLEGERTSDEIDNKKFFSTKKQKGLVFPFFVCYNGVGYVKGRLCILGEDG